MILGICAIIKDCPEKHLIEWVEWHTKLGVDYFFIFDNESNVPIEQTLCSYENVFAYTIEGKVQQLPAYNTCLRMQKQGTLPKCDWIAFIDDDEFINVDTRSIKEILQDTHSSGLGLNWIVFGTCKKEEEHLSQVERYKYHVPIWHEVNKHIKSIVQPLLVDKFVNPHFCKYLRGECTSIMGEKISQAWVQVPVKRIAWINHYYCKTKEEFEQKIRKGRVDCLQGYNIQMFEDIKQAAICRNT